MIIEPDNFSIDEFRCHCGECKLLLDSDLLDRAHDLRKALGAPLIVSSAHRCEGYNSLVGGAQNSQHLHGKAMDLLPSEHRFKQFVYLCLAMDPPGMGVYYNPEMSTSSFVHFDLRDIEGARWAYLNGEKVSLDLVLAKLEEAWK